MAHATGNISGSGQFSKSFPSAMLTPSGQQPKRVSLQTDGGQPFSFLPLAGETPSEQQPCFDSMHVSGAGQPVTS